MMKVVGLSGTIVGSKTKTAVDYTLKTIAEKYPGTETMLIDLAEYQVQFSDGRNYLDYEGDTGMITRAIMDADVLIIGTPIFQASIPGTLKNIFDLLPQYALKDKVVSIVATAGSSRHFLVPEQQLKPILTYLKAQLVQNYVFIEEQDFYRKEIVNDDVKFRIERLAEDTMMLAETYANIREAAYNEL